MQQAFVVIEPEQQRADKFSSERIPESTDDAVGRAQTLHLHHAVAIAALIRQVETLGDDSIHIAAGAGEPALRDFQISGFGRQLN